MTFLLASQFYVYLIPCLDGHLALCLNSVLNVKAVVAEPSDGTFSSTISRVSTFLEWISVAVKDYGSSL